MNRIRTKRAKHDKDCVCNACAKERKAPLDAMLERTAIVQFIQKRARHLLHVNRRKDMAREDRLAFKGVNYLAASTLERIAEAISRGEHR